MSLGEKGMQVRREAGSEGQSAGRDFVLRQREGEGALLLRAVAKVASSWREDGSEAGQRSRGAGFVAIESEGGGMFC